MFTRNWPWCCLFFLSFSFKVFCCWWWWCFVCVCVCQTEKGVQDTDLEFNNYISSINQWKKTVLFPCQKCSVGQDKWNFVWTIDSMQQIYYKSRTKVKVFGFVFPLGKNETLRWTENNFESIRRIDKAVNITSLWILIRDSNKNWGTQSIHFKIFHRV